MLVPPDGRNACAVQAVEAMLRIAGGNAALVRKAIARCRELAVGEQNWALFEDCDAQLAALALRSE